MEEEVQRLKILIDMAEYNFPVSIQVKETYIKTWYKVLSVLYDTSKAVC